MALPPIEVVNIVIAAHYLFIDPERMKGWVDLVGWPPADGLPIQVVTHQLKVERETGKVRWPRPTFLPLCHSTNQLVCHRHMNYMKTFKDVYFVWPILYTHNVVHIIYAVHSTQHSIRYITHQPKTPTLPRNLILYFATVSQNLSRRAITFAKLAAILTLSLGHVT